MEVADWWVFGVFCLAGGFYALVVWMQWPSSPHTEGNDGRRVHPWMLEWKPLVAGLGAILIGVLVMLRIIRFDGP